VGVTEVLMSRELRIEEERKIREELRERETEK